MNCLRAALLGILLLPAAVRGETPSPDFPGEPVQAQFRGCESAGWCRFWVEPRDPLAQSLYRVRPAGVPAAPENSALAIAVRDRLNALMASFVHQHKRIVLYDLRKLDDGTYAATVTTNEADLATDPQLQALGSRAR